jgi:hypothetical protein
MNMNMFVPFDISGTGKGKHLGYWARNLKDNPHNLPWPGDFIDLNWNPTERDLVVNYLERPWCTDFYYGFSPCRLCKQLLASGDPFDGIYTWPKGFSHYLKQHNVKPPQEFIDHATGRIRHTITYTPRERLPNY